MGVMDPHSQLIDKCSLISSLEHFRECRLRDPTSTENLVECTVIMTNVHIINHIIAKLQGDQVSNQKYWHNEITKTTFIKIVFQMQFLGLHGVSQKTYVLRL